MNLKEAWETPNVSSVEVKTPNGTVLQDIGERYTDDLGISGISFFTHEDETRDIPSPVGESFEVIRVRKR